MAKPQKKLNPPKKVKRARKPAVTNAAFRKEAKPRAMTNMNANRPQRKIRIFIKTHPVKKS
jgi:hypothetical protein